jgi:hypothetical protein
VAVIYTCGACSEGPWSTEEDLIMHMDGAHHQKCKSCGHEKWTHIAHIDCRMDDCRCQGYSSDD